MGWSGKTALAALFLVGGSGIGFAQEANPPAAPAFDDVVGKKLVAIDGSSILLRAAEGGLARDVVSASGTDQKTFFTFINDRLGTVADGSDLRKVIGVFRKMDGGIEIDYADGTTETLAVNPSGGITTESVSAAAASCVAWYPEGHQFSLDERKAALAAFAERLGLADSVPGPGAKSGCGTHQATASADVKAAEPAMSQAAVPPTPIPRPLLAGTGESAGAVPLKTADLAAAAQAIEVRNSEVHVIDGNPAAVPQQPQVLASANPPSSTVSDQNGASACLSVESDGMHWGFRNHCGYTVQFAYCLMTGGALASCKDGAVMGSVEANGFGDLIADESLKETDAEHDFRWVACQGGAGEVIPHLDQPDPPSGRCVR